MFQRKINFSVVTVPSELDIAQLYLIDCIVTFFLGSVKREQKSQNRWYIFIRKSKEGFAVN